MEEEWSRAAPPGATVLGKVRMFCCSLLAQPGSDYGAEEYLVQQDGLYVLVPVDLEYYDY